LYSTYGLFDEVAVQEVPVSGAKLIKNLQDQVIEFQYWQGNLDSLAAKGVDSGLITELQEMGPRSTAEIKALNKMTGPELEMYVRLWTQKHSQVKDQATEELEGLRLATVDKIAELNTIAVTELDEYRKTWATQMSALTTDANTQLETLKTDWLAKIGTIRSTTEKEFAAIGTNIQAEMKKPNWSALGTNIIAGITQGVKSEAMVLATATATAARNALQSANKALGIKSPSTEFAKVGMYSIQGFAQGLTKFAGTAITAAQNLGNSSISALQSTISKISDVINGNVDSSPVIRPVLDLTSIEAGGKQISGMFVKNPGINVSSAQNKAANISGIGRDGVNPDVAGQTNNTTNPIIQLQNYFTVRNDDDIRKIGHRLGNIIDRYSNAKGVTVG
jgi:hypothetical protein